MPVTVKICGITNHDDAAMAARAGADALGFVFYPPSPRWIPIAEAAEITRNMPGPVLKVGVFVNAAEEEVRRAIDQCGLNLLQFHGEEPPAYCLQFGVPSMKAFRIRDEASLKALLAYHSEMCLLDAYTPGRLGGTGECFNWELAVRAKETGRPFFLAGGLTPENVAEAVRRVRPFGVDVSSGVEALPGRKDHEKVCAFIKAARAAAGV